MKRANIRVIVAERGGAQRVADWAGVSVNAVYGWIRDNSLPLDRADMLASELDIDRDLLHDPWRGRSGREMLTPDETRALFKGD